MGAVHGRVDLLVNNAGVAVGGTFEQVGEADFDWLIAINFDAVVRMTRAFLPLLHTSDDARIVNISSIYGIVAPAGQTAYSASKFAVRGFSNALRHELEGTRVGVTVVHPGGVATAIARSARVPAAIPAVEVERRRAAADRKLRMPPARAGEIVVRAIERGAARVLVGADAVVVAARTARAGRLLARAAADVRRLTGAPTADRQARRPRPRPQRAAPPTTQCGGDSQKADWRARSDACALCSIASTGPRRRSP